MDGGGDVVAVGRAEIDTRAPFRSVKEAVVLFGEGVLAGELYAGRRLTENRAAATSPINDQFAAGAVAAAPRHVPPVTSTELEEAKQTLEKEREEKQKMAGCIPSLKEELKNLNARDEEAAAKVIDLQVEDLKFVEIEKQQQSPPRGALTNNNNATAVNSAAGEFQKKRYVTFADPPTAAYRAPPLAPLPDVVMELQQRAPAAPQYREVRFQRHMPAGNEVVKAATEEVGRKKKKKTVIPLVGALFMRKKKQSSCHDDSALMPRPSF